MKAGTTFLITMSLLAAFSLSFSHTSKKRKFVPPGTVRIAGEFFADETEVTNLAWLEYEYWTAVKYGHRSPEHIKVLPDTLVWKTYSTEPDGRTYYRGKAYRNHPVVGVSYLQALSFCKWRSERVKELYAIRYRENIDLEYTLPSREQWEQISMTSSAFLRVRDHKGRQSLNYLEGDNTAVLNKNSNAAVTVPVNSYTKSRHGLYQCVGNVAEMVIEPGVCKGGSWNHSLEECRVGRDIIYTKPGAWLGFRCVCLVHREI